jgi:hypothetical protein
MSHGGPDCVIDALTRSQLDGGGLIEAIARNDSGNEVGHESFKLAKQ